MNDIKSYFRLSTIDWKWVGVGYCFFVVFHLLPSYLLAGFTWSRNNMGDGVWLFVGVAAIAFYIGYRSRGVTILEPAIAALLYDLTLLLEFNRYWGRSVSHSWGIIYVWGMITLVVAICSAWIGEIVQARKQTPTSTPS